MSKSLPLSSIFAISVCSAALGALAAVNAEDNAALRYAGVFICAFAGLSLLSRHVKFTVKPQGLENIHGFAPKAARAVLMLLAFALPLAALHARAPQNTEIAASLLGINTSHAPATAPGYKKTDRQKLEKLIHKGTQGND